MAEKGHRYQGEVVDTDRCGSGTWKGTREKSELWNEPGRARLGGEFRTGFFSLSNRNSLENTMKINVSIFRDQ